MLEAVSHGGGSRPCLRGGGPVWGGPVGSDQTGAPWARDGSTGPTTRIGGRRDPSLAGQEEPTATREDLTPAESRDALVERGFKPSTRATLRSASHSHLKKSPEATEQDRAAVADHG